MGKCAKCKEESPRLCLVKRKKTRRSKKKTNMWVCPPCAERPTTNRLKKGAELVAFSKKQHDKLSYDLTQKRWNP